MTDYQKCFYCEKKTKTRTDHGGITIHTSCIEKMKQEGWIENDGGLKLSRHRCKRFEP